MKPALRAPLGGASQVSQALKALQDRGVLVRIGTGVYAKTRKSSVTGATIPTGSLETLAAEALRKLGVSLSAGARLPPTTQARQPRCQALSWPTPGAGASAEKSRSEGVRSPMRTITAAQKQALEDLAAEGLLRGLPAQTAEKDIHIIPRGPEAAWKAVHPARMSGTALPSGRATRYPPPVAG